MKKFVVDRIEGDYAVCLDEHDKIHEIQLARMGFTVKEGTFVLYDKKKDIYYEDTADSEKAKEVNRNRLKQIFHRKEDK
ncbi:MAG: hypothetical protein A2Y15_08200 [Clostridiales bacterium GWF2_36_10]|nr:MAG: hypothetical protein A2Y15_08200 [Clostridiales bacterium GWF2_36_10]HAN21029.1 hypothetical protein [Clostridiales bacterium]